MKKLTIGAMAAAICVFGACDFEADADIDEAALEETYESARADAEEAGAELREAGEEFGREVEELFAEFDRNADRVFDDEEFEAWWSRANPFDDWDVDENDRIVAAEWDDALEIEMDEVDANGDGYVTRAELEQGLFEALDENDNGRIDRDEWRVVELELV